MQLLTKNIVLIGMPGSGKSSIGAKLAATLQMDFCDIDRYIEEAEQKSVPELFRIGEEYFREIESNAVRSLCCKQSTIIATGGGVVTKPNNMAMLEERGIIFYIERPLEMIISSVDLSNRPLLAQNTQRIHTLYKERKHLYEKYCHYRISNSYDLAAAVAAIQEILRQP